MEHKDYVLPEVDLSHDEGDPCYLEHGRTTPIYREDGTIRGYQWNGLEPGHYAGYWQLCVVDSWAERVAAYEADQNVYNAWWYVDHHPVFWKFSKPIHDDYPVNHVSHLEHDGAWHRGWPEIIPHKICPETRRIEEDKLRNTATEWWYEFGNIDLYPNEHGIHDTYHDYQLDGGADSYDDAVLEVAWKIHEYYGNDRRLVDDKGCWDNRVVPAPSGGWGKLIEEMKNDQE